MRRINLRYLEPAAAFLAIAAIALVAAWPALTPWDYWGIQDWDQHTFHHAVARASILEHGQIPLWNPYNDSGVALLANPESRVLAPGFAFVLVLGEVKGLKLEILLHLLLGMLGAFALLANLGVSRFASFVGACVFGLNTWYSVHLTVGHIWALNAAFMPWLLLCYSRSLDDRRFVLPAAIVAVLMLFGGGPYPLVMALLVIVLWGLSDALLRGRSLTLHLRRLAAVGLIALPLAAVKLLPMTENLALHPRPTAVEGGYSWGALHSALLDRGQALPTAFHQRPAEFNGTGVHEGLYVGVLPLLLVFAGALAHPRRAAPFLLPLPFIAWLVLGTEVSPSLWALLHQLPPFDQMRMVQRFGIVGVLLLSVVAGLGLDALRRESALAACALATAVVVDLVAVNRTVWVDAFPIPPHTIEAESEFRQADRPPPYDAQGTLRRFLLSGTLSGIYPAFLANRGAARGYTVVPTGTHALPMSHPDYRGEVFLASGEGRAAYRRWSPNRLEIELAAERADHVVVNQNFDPGWRVLSPDGREARSFDGRLSVAVVPEDRSVVLIYRPRSFLAGATLSAAAATFAAWLVLVQVRQRRRASRTGDSSRPSSRLRSSSA